MNEKRGIEVLARLRDLLGAGVHPTVRGASLTEAEARWLVPHRFITLGDKKTWVKDKDATPFEDRYEIAEITDAALSHLASSGSSPSPVVHTKVETAPVSVWSKIFRASGTGLWDLIKIALAVAGTLFVAWFVWKNNWK
jgi:hypothetical protein